MNYSGYLKDSEGNIYYPEIKNAIKLNVKSLLENSWEEHYSNQIFKINNIVYVSLCVKKGTTTTILTLPELFRPNITLMYFPISIDGNIASFVTINANGQINCASQGVGKLLFINFSYLVE